jgi:uncharacterized protein DUF1990
MSFPDLGVRPGDTRGRLSLLRTKGLNFDPRVAGGPGWQRDDYRRALPSEAPGPPEAGGSWQIASRLSREYAFSDPSLVEAHFDGDVVTEGQDMLLVLHALGLRIYAGVRVGEVSERTRDEAGRSAVVSAWNYRTLEGHVEAGQRDYEVWKWLDTGEVEFRTHAVSRPAAANPVVQLGFHVLGRHKQVEFGRTAGSRMALLTAAALQQGGASTGGRVVDGSLLGVYLRDHHALLVALRELAGRIGSSSPRDVERSFGSRLEAKARADLSALDATLGRLELGRSRAKDASVWIGEKLARTKLNGRVASRSPLSSVTELEGCRLLLESARQLWSGLAELGLDPADARERAARASEDADEAERLRLAALADAVRPSPAAGSRAQK